jgi:hypothetical protein
MPVRTVARQDHRAPLLTMGCHCTGCQRMSASAFSLSAAIPTEGFSVIKGAPVIGGLHGVHRHNFCPHCKSWMWREGGPFIPGTLFDFGGNSKEEYGELLALSYPSPNGTQFIYEDFRQVLPFNPCPTF